MEQDERMKSGFQQSNRCLSSSSIKALERKKYLCNTSGFILKPFGCYTGT